MVFLSLLLVSYVLRLGQLLRSLPITVPVAKFLRLLVVLGVALSAVELHAAVRLHVSLRGRCLSPLASGVVAELVLVLDPRV